MTVGDVGQLIVGSLEDNVLPLCGGLELGVGLDAVHACAHLLGKDLSQLLGGDLVAHLQIAKLGSNVLFGDLDGLAGGVVGDGDGDTLGGIIQAAHHMGHAVQADLEARLAAVNIVALQNGGLARAVGGVGRVVAGAGGQHLANDVIGRGLLAVNSGHVLGGLGGGVHRVGAGVQGAVQQLGAVEVGGLADAVDFVQQLVHLVLEGAALGAGVGAVGGLTGQLHHTVQHGVDLGEVPLSGLDEGDAVLGVGGRSFKTGDLRLHLLADSETCGVITSPVDPEAGGQFFQRLSNSAGVHAQLPVSVERHCISSYDHSHGETSLYYAVPSLEPRFFRFPLPLPAGPAGRGAENFIKGRQPPSIPIFAIFPKN